MSETIRSYFSLRYALPGYTFLTIILLMNIEFFMNTPSYSMDHFGTILGFLVSGSAIGFIVSQPWYWIYNYSKCPEQLKKRRAYQELLKIYPVVKYISTNSHESEDSVSIMAYALTQKIPEKITIYINRLNDMINSLASTISAVVSGLFSGHIIRLVVFKKGLVDYDFVIWWFFMLFTIFIYYNYKRVFKEHDSIAYLMVKLKSEELNKEFLKLIGL